MAQQHGQGPMVVLSEESQQTSGMDAQKMNIQAGRAIEEAILTTLGPKGMDKMLVDGSGSVIVTNDGVTILQEMDIEHPAANMVVQVAETQENQVGDGTTTAVVNAGELLAQAEDLLGGDVHPTTLVAGYRQAAGRATEVLDDIAIDVSVDDEEVLRQVASTAMTGKGAEAQKERLARLVVDAVRRVADEDGVATADVSVETEVGGSLSDSELRDGVLVDKEAVHQNMPIAVEDANVAVFDGEIAVRESEYGAEVTVSDTDEYEQFVEREVAEIRDTVQQFVDVVADVVLTDGRIEDAGERLLADEGVMALEQLSKSDQTAVAHATGATIRSGVEEFTEDDLGHAGTVSHRDVDDSQTIIEDVEYSDSVTLVLRGGTAHVVEEVERAIEDAIGVVETTVEEGAVLPGGGAAETELALALRDYADSFDGREQLAVTAFADALEVVPRTLAQNAGIDSIDSLVELRARHDDGDTSAGLDAHTGEIVDMVDAGVVEPLTVKTRAVESAADAAEMILRIDDVISAGDLQGGGDYDEEDPDTGGPTDYSDVGGMAGMGDL